MKKFLTILYLSFIPIAFLEAQIIPQRKTVSMGAGYAQQVWYNLKTGTETKGSSYSWDLAVSVRGFDAAIFTNPFDTVYRAVNSGANYAAVSASDTLPKALSRVLFNPDSSWNVGSLTSTSAGLFDYGWGTYTQVTNNVIGDSTYIIKLQNGTWKKFFIERLTFDTLYSIRVANLDGSDLRTLQINKKAYLGRNFVYLNLSSGTVFNLEPDNKSWDLLFTRYSSKAPSPFTGLLENYIVAGVLQNSVLYIIRGVPQFVGASAQKVIRRDTASDVFSSTLFKTPINVIGSDWKSFNQQRFIWEIADTVTYFVKPATDTAVYKLIFKDFGGSMNGNFVFTQERLITSSIKFIEGVRASFALQSNPSMDGQVSLVFDLGKKAEQASISLFDLNGKQVYQQKLQNTEGGLQILTLPYLGLAKGLFIAQLRFDGHQLVQKVFVQ
jgi:hypothetical protein